MSDDTEEKFLCAFCSKDSDLDMQILPNGQPILLCNSCAAAMATAAETAQKQFDMINEAAANREIQTRALLILGALFLATGAGFWARSVAAGVIVFGACFFAWGFMQRVKE